MSQKQMKQIEHDLLGSLLQDIDLQKSSIKSASSLPDRMQAFSAPPIFSEVHYKLDFDLLETSTFQSPDPQDQSIMEAFLKRQTNLKRSFQQSHSTSRKMSCDSVLLESRQTYIPSPFNYYEYISAYSPIQEVFQNLERVQDWARDQNGSRTVQDIFDTGTDERKGQLFQALYQNSLNLMTDRFGNYVFQKIFEKGLQKNKKALANKMSGSLISLSFHSYGCRVVQKALQYIKGKKELEDSFIIQITPHSFRLIENQNGNHVIQKCFQVFPHSKIVLTAEIIKNNLGYLAYHPYGCRVIQKYLQSYPEQGQCQQVLSVLLQQSIPLSLCQFGNYVMQHVVSKCKKQRKVVFQAFLMKLFELSTNKYASNVIEKAIQASQSSFGQELAQWFCSNPKQLILLTKHQFGNYVVQSTLNRVPKDKKAQIASILRQNINDISKSQHGRHVLLQLDHQRPRY